MTAKIILKPGRDQSVLRKHPWIFSGGIFSIEGNPKAGDTVYVYSNNSRLLAWGFYAEGSIAVRLMGFDDGGPTAEFWENKIQNALDWRAKTGFFQKGFKGAFRLLHGEGDFVSGLIIDIYGTCAVMQAHDAGVYGHLDSIALALQKVFKGKLTSIYDKSSSSLHSAVPVENKFYLGNEVSGVIVEDGIKMEVNWETGQKTGFFLDQSANRKLLGEMSKGKSVLNTYCYTGGFSLHALSQGASLVCSVDSSAKAIDLVNNNVSLNKFTTEHTAVCDDVIHFFRNDERKFDVIVVDPPAFSKSIQKRHQAVQGYKRLNDMALQKVAPGGLLFTFSCSQVVDRALFYHTIHSAAIEAGRNVRVLHHLSQAADHPVNIFHPEGEYLKGLVLAVD